MIKREYLAHILDGEVFVNLEELKDLISEIFNYYLLGKSITDMNGKRHKVEKCICRYVDLEDSDFYSVNVYLFDYNYQEHFLYYDDVFESNLNNLIPIYRSEYSEQGMQGSNYVNLDVVLRK